MKDFFKDNLYVIFGLLAVVSLLFGYYQDTRPYDFLHITRYPNLQDFLREIGFGIGVTILLKITIDKNEKNKEKEAIKAIYKAHKVSFEGLCVDVKSTDILYGISCFLGLDQKDIQNMMNDLMFEKNTGSGKLIDVIKDRLSQINNMFTASESIYTQEQKTAYQEDYGDLYRKIFSQDGLNFMQCFVGYNHIASYCIDMYWKVILLDSSVGKKIYAGDVSMETMISLLEKFKRWRDGMAFMMNANKFQQLYYHLKQENTNTSKDVIEGTSYHIVLGFFYENIVIDQDFEKILLMYILFVQNFEHFYEKLFDKEIEKEPTL